ncbi:unnamed protein product, partial [Rotaria socialis]
SRFPNESISVMVVIYPRAVIIAVLSIRSLPRISLSTCLFREGIGPNIDSVTKSTNKQADGPTYGVFLETSDIYIGKQINTHFYYCLLVILKNKLEN